MNTSATAQRAGPAGIDESTSRLGLRAGLSSAAVIAVLLAIAIWQSGIISLNASSSAVIDPQDASGAEKAGFITPSAHPDDQEVAWEVSANVLQNDYDREVLATAHGPALLVDANARPAESQDSSSDSVGLSTPGSPRRQSTAVVSLDQETGTVRDGTGRCRQKPPAAMRARRTPRSEKTGSRPRASWPAPTASTLWCGSCRARSRNPLGGEKM